MQGMQTRGLDLFHRLSADLLIQPAELRILIASAPKRYKVYQIPKRAGGFRTIAQPTPVVKRLQRWTMANILGDLPLHDAAAAYRKGRGIGSNARIHAKHRFLLKLDFLNFFPSLVADDFRLLVLKSKLPFSEEEITALCRILFRQSRGTDRLELSIGAPSSPMVSNALLFEFDSIVFDFCHAQGVAYSRYADDLSFTTDRTYVLQKIHEFVQLQCEGNEWPRLSLNPRKTVYSSKKNRRIVTGLVLSNSGKISIGREKKRLLASKVHRFVTGHAHAPDPEQLKGYLAFVRDVEPSLFQKIIERYSNHNEDRLRQIGLR